MEGNKIEYQLQSKRIPLQTTDEAAKNIIREVETAPPPIFGQNDLGLKRIQPNTLITDSSHHKNGQIKQSIYASELKKLFTLDSLSNEIFIYSRSCKFEKSIKPSACRHNKDLIIIDFAFSEKQQRVPLKFN